MKWSIAIPIVLLLNALISCVPVIPAPTPNAPNAANLPLKLDEFPLAGTPPVESTTLTFADGTQSDRNLRLQGETVFNTYESCRNITPDLRARCARQNDDILIAMPGYQPPDIYHAIVTRNGQEIYRVRIGQPSLPPEIQGIWAWDDHWALETILHDWQTSDGHVTFMRGQISLDGELLNEKFEWEEAFGFQLLSGKPFFFFKHQGIYHAWYDGAQMPLGYEEIPHYLCCSASTKNPYAHKEMISFFGRHENQWYYAELRPVPPTPGQ